MKKPLRKRHSFVSKIREVAEDSIPTILGVILLFTGLSIGKLSFEFLYTDRSNKQFIQDFYANVSSDLVSIAFTILIIDRLNQRRITNQEKKELILQMGSPNNLIAVEAVRKLRLLNWLLDGSLRGAYLEDADLHDADLEKADLRQANLKGSSLENANLRNADLRSTNLKNANTSGVVFHGALVNSETILPDSGHLVWDIVNNDKAGADLANIDLSRSVLRGAKLSGAILMCSKLNGVDLTDAKLTRADLSNVELNGSILYGTVLRNADLKDSELQRADLSNADLTDADLQGVNLYGARLENTILQLVAGFLIRVNLSESLEILTLLST